ncbi:4Fe-4S dicluster domain-containing protein [Aminithiophilus ramosus]|uniref:4Fe-4S dicluster domain-containing protein n=2 Tax=Synergistales TaxID=649776 RepID=A0A9Q7EYX3_9BACT|nr:4Fe-4S dicluster domain-containing protein [Aminithiophilus ramosus]QTX32486.1 4Fe-4S dicluster domain-containing protein [Aminithiophilus ramosus]QVL36363.1 4Fe-4S dicluster domain-containing protein [Synergistota bacterium]
MGKQNPIDLKSWQGIRSVLQLQLMVAFVVAVLVLKQWWFCVLMIALGGLLSAFRGKIWCGLLCPNGGFIDLIWSRLSLRLLPFPRWLNRGRVLQGSMLLAMAGYFAWIVWFVTVRQDLPFSFASFSLHGLLFLRFCQFMLALAAVMAIVFEPRSFCAHICPGGTLGTLAAKAAGRSPIVIDSARCVGCNLCTQVCDAPERLLLPLIDEARALRQRGEAAILPVSSECYGCLDCVAACPQEALRIETPRRKRKGES